jgi:hypothetical protein
MQKHYTVVDYGVYRVPLCPRSQIKKQIHPPPPYNPPSNVLYMMVTYTVYWARPYEL